MPPYTLPQYKTRSTFKSQSHKRDGSNELRFEDEGGEEEVYLHAQKYLNAVVEDHETWLVGGSRDVTIGINQSETIGGHKDMTVGGEHREVVGASRHETIGGSNVRAVGASDSLDVGADQLISVGGDQHSTVGGSFRIEVGGNAQSVTGSNHYMLAGSNVVIEAGTSICLKVGGNFVKIDPSGVQIEGTMVLINCGSPAAPGTKVTAKKSLTPQKFAGPHAVRYPRSKLK